MDLHKDKENFAFVVRATSRFFNVSPSIIEKDYYVTLFLSELAQQVPYLIFKGGTSLSKCYKKIDRFSEDIDITLDFEHQSQAYLKNLKNTIFKICDKLDMNLLNKEEIRTRRKYNCYKIDYFTKHSFLGLNPQLLIETSFIVDAFPVEIKKAASMIYDYLKINHNDDVIIRYKLEPFDVCVQTLNRTFIDKVFALCDYMIDNDTERRSRHIYDLSQLLPFVELDKQKKLIKEVRECRKKAKKCHSAQDEVSIPKLLKRMIETNFFEKDYEKNTEKLLFKKISYEEAINVLNVVIQSGVFD